MNNVTHVKFLFTLVLASMVAACSGGGQSPAPGAPAPPASTAPQHSVRVTIRVALPTPKPVRKKHYFISPATQSVSVTVTSGRKSQGPYVGNCQAGFCIQTVDAPIGTDTFNVSLYDAANATGHLLSSGASTAAVAAGKNNVITVTFNPVVASASGMPTVPVFAGTPTSVPVALPALDPSGAAIVGPGFYEDANGKPIVLTLSLSDPTGHSTLAGQTSYASPAPAGATPAATLTYDGTPPNFAYPELHVSANGKSLGASTVPLLPSPITQPVRLVPSGYSVTSATRGPDGNVWFTASANGANAEIGKYDVTSNAVTIYPLTNGAAAPQSIVSAPDGNLYFFELKATTIGTITTSGVVREYPVSFSISGLVPGVDGNVWFIEGTHSGTPIGKITPAGAVTTYGVGNISVVGLTAGPNGRMWLLAGGNPQPAQLGSIKPDGTGLNLVAMSAQFDYAFELNYGRDGNFYYVFGFNFGNAGVARVTTGGSVSDPCPGSGVSSRFGFVNESTLFDGSLLFTTATGGYGEYETIRSDGTCVSASSGSISLNLLAPIAPATTGTAYSVGPSIVKFAY